MASYFLLILPLQFWSTPINLGIVGIDDRNPQICRLQVPYACLVWQSYINNNWEIFSRFNYGEFWSDTIRITNNTVSDINPSVAYDYSRNCFWCVWQNNSAGNWNIFVAKGDTTNHWQSPYQLTNSQFDDKSPSICVTNDTVWVVWECGPMAEAVNILASYYDGTTWSAPMSVTLDSFYDNLNPRINLRYAHPFVVWEKNGDVYYNEYIGGSWQTAQRITSDPADDLNPEIAVYSFFPYTYGVWVFWESNRDGNWEIYRTGYDSLNNAFRVTFNNVVDTTPCPFYFIAVTRWMPLVSAYSSIRNGNEDIYTFFDSPGWESIYVDTHYARDILPVVTQSEFCLWVLWQTDRNGDWDIYGSYMNFGRMEEARHYLPRIMFQINPDPFTTELSITYGIEDTKLSTRNWQTSSISLKIYDVTGRLVRQWNALPMQSKNKIIWSGLDNAQKRVPNGIYIIQLESRGEILQIKKVIKI